MLPSVEAALSSSDSLRKKKKKKEKKAKKSKKHKKKHKSSSGSVRTIVEKNDKSFKKMYIY